MAVSVDWEGATLDAPDLAALERLERALPGVPLTHFVSAAYFTKPGADPEAVRRALARVVRPEDEVGVHLHAWTRLVEAAGVEPRFEPSYLGRDDWALDGETGWDVEIESYQPSELEAIVRTSMALLSLESPRSFRAGAWLAGPRVLEAVRRCGFAIDSSASDAAWYDELAATPLPSRLKQVWPHVRRETQPFWISTAGGAILEMPLTGGMADYVTAQELEDHVGSMLARAVEQNRRLFVQTGLHQEGAADLADRVIESLTSVMAAHGDRVDFETVATCAARVDVPAQ